MLSGLFRQKLANDVEMQGLLDDTDDNFGLLYYQIKMLRRYCNQKTE
jgi:hypothetical protein